MSQQSAQQLQQQFQAMMNCGEQCLSEVKLLRKEVVKVLRKISDLATIENETLDEHCKYASEKMEQINKIYESLETHAKKLPTSMPSTVQMDRLSRLLHDGHIDPHTSEVYDKLLDASSWMDTNSHLLQMLGEFLRSVVTHRRRSIMTNKALSYSNFSANASPQFIFEQTLAAVLKDPNSKKIGLMARYLERSTLSAVIEFKFGQFADKQYVCLLKMLLVVNNGIFEFVQMIAAHEEWSYLDTSQKQVDIHKESRYLVYRKMSVQANIHLMQTITPWIDIHSSATISHILSLFSKFSGVFEVKCRFCRKIMKDYLPPLVFDLRNAKNALHESCR